MKTADFARISYTREGLSREQETELVLRVHSGSYITEAPANGEDFHFYRERKRIEVSGGNGQLRGAFDDIAQHMKTLGILRRYSSSEKIVLQAGNGRLGLLEKYSSGGRLRARQIECRTEDAGQSLDKMTLENFPLVISIAKRLDRFGVLGRYGVDIDELIQQGILDGLIKAVDRFNPYHAGKGGKFVKFDTFAYRLIINEMMRTIRKARKYHEFFSGRSDILNPNSQDLLIDRNSEGGYERAVDDEKRRLLKEAMKYSSARERAIFELRMGGKNYAEIGEILGLSKWGVIQNERRAIGKVRKFLFGHVAI